MYFRCSGYHEKNYAPRSLKAQVKRVVRNLKKLQKKVKFDAIAFSGLSGAAVAYPVSALGGFHLITVRKSRAKSHGGHVEGSEKRNIQRYIILDDFVGKGTTVTTIVRTIINLKTFGDETPECVGVAVYDKVLSTKSVYINKTTSLPVFTV